MTSALPASAHPHRVQVETPAEIVDRMMADTRARLADHADKTKASDTVEAYTATFTNAWVETYRGTTPRVPGPKELYVLRSSLRARYRDNPQIRHAFLEFVVRNWPVIIADQFAWMTYRQPPSLPDIAFMCGQKFITRFMDAFADKERIEHARLLPAEERDLDHLIANGKTREEALLDIGERRALSRIRGEDEERRRSNSKALKERMEARAEREKAMREEMHRRAEERRREAARPALEEGIAPMEFTPIELPPFDPSAFD